MCFSPWVVNHFNTILFFFFGNMNKTKLPFSVFTPDLPSTSEPWLHNSQSFGVAVILHMLPMGHVLPIPLPLPFFPSTFSFFLPQEQPFIIL